MAGEEIAFDARATLQQSRRRSGPMVEVLGWKPTTTTVPSITHAYEKAKV
jgi:hypothetical protein